MGFVKDFTEGMSNVMDFLGGGLGSEALSAVADAVDLSQAMSSAVEVYDNALASCGTEGQMALVDQIGADGFKESILYGMENDGDINGFLGDMTEHPEAISEILDEAESQLSDILDSLLGQSPDEDD